MFDCKIRILGNTREECVETLMGTFGDRVMLVTPTSPGELLRFDRDHTCSLTGAKITKGDRKIRLRIVAANAFAEFSAAAKSEVRFSEKSVWTSTNVHSMLVNPDYGRTADFELSWEHYEIGDPLARRWTGVVVWLSARDINARSRAFAETHDD